MRVTLDKKKKEETMVLYGLMATYLVMNTLTFILDTPRSRGFFIPIMWCSAFFLPFTLREWSYATLAHRQFTEYGAYFWLGLFTLTATWFLLKECYEIIYSSLILRSWSARDLVNEHNQRLENTMKENQAGETIDQ
jgi:hypothetical protein